MRKKEGWYFVRTEELDSENIYILCFEIIDISF